MEQVAVTKSKYYWLIRTHYLARATAFAALFVAIGMHMLEHGAGVLAWGLLVLQFLVYPHLVYWRAQTAADPIKTELANLLLDSLLVGIWAAALAFPLWIAFTLYIGTALNNAINRGWRGALWSSFAYAVGALAWGLVAGFEIVAATDLPVTSLCLVGLTGYVLGLGNIVYAQTRKLRERDKTLAIQAHAFENMAEGMMIVGIDGTILSVNRAFTAVTGYSKEDVLGKPENQFRTAMQPPKFYVDIHEALKQRGYWSGTTWCRRKDEQMHRERRSVSAIRDVTGGTTHYIYFFAVAGDSVN